MLLVIIVPLVSWWAKKRFKDGVENHVEVVAPSSRLTSNALRELASPPWRVVYEISPDKLSGVEHVLIGPPGAFAVVTVLDPLPPDPVRMTGDRDAGRRAEPDPRALAQAAITRGGLDDALRRCALSSVGLLRVHWGQAAGGSPQPVNVMHGVTAVDGRQLQRWASQLGPEADTNHERPTLTSAQVDLAWQTVLTSIGRPDPLK